MTVHELDTTGLRCPLPVLRARKRLGEAVAPGECLRVTATDPAAPNDFRAFCEAAGHALLESTSAAGPDGPVYVLLIRRRAN